MLIKKIINKLIYKEAMQIGAIASIEILENFKNQLNAFEENGVPFTYHNVSVEIDNMIKGLKQGL